MNQAIRSSAIVPITLLLVGCANAGQTKLADKLAIPIGDTKAACQGDERIVKALESTTINRSLNAAGDGCKYGVYWSGRLLDGRKLKAELERGGSTKLKQIRLIFEPAQLADELGSALASVSIRSLSLTLSMQGQEILSIKAEERVGAFGQRKAVTLAQELVDAIQLAMSESKPLLATVNLSFELADATRRELATKARGPLFELKYTVDIQSAPLFRSGR